MSQAELEDGRRLSYTPTEIERLGRERPEAFTSIWTEIGFCFALLGSMFVAEYFISGFNVLLPALATALDIPPQAETWPASVFSLVTGAFLLPLGRLADMFGGYIVFVSGLVWFVIWSIIAGFSQNYMMLIFCRALQGFAWLTRSETSVGDDKTRCRWWLRPAMVGEDDRPPRRGYH